MISRVAPYRLVIRRSQSWLDLDLQSVWNYRDLLLLLVRRDFVAKYKQTILGPAWFIVQPVLMTLVFGVIFGTVAKIPTEGVPPNLFYLCGLLGWNYFSQNFSVISDTFIAQAQIFSKVYFPRLVVPLAAILSNLFALGIQMATFAAFFLFYKAFTDAGSSFGVRWQMVFFPLVVLQVAALSLGVGLWMSALTAKYRDLKHLSAFLIQIWMYGTPVIYPLAKVPVDWRWLVLLNPMTAPTEAIKFMFLGAGSLDSFALWTSVGVTFLIMATGLLIFRKTERTFIDTV